MKQLWLTLALTLGLHACITPSLIDPADRARGAAPVDRVWRAASTADLPGVYVSSQLRGEIAGVLLKVVYLFEANGVYTGAALVDSAPPHFEVISGTWNMQESELTLDAATPASVEVSQERSLRITGKAGQIILRREIDQ